MGRRRRIRPGGVYLPRRRRISRGGVTPPRRRRIRPWGYTHPTTASEGGVHTPSPPHQGGCTHPVAAASPLALTTPAPHQRGYAHPSAASEGVCTPQRRRISRRAGVYLPQRRRISRGGVTLPRRRRISTFGLGGGRPPSPPHQIRPGYTYPAAVRGHVSLFQFFNVCVVRDTYMSHLNESKVLITFIGSKR